MTSSVTGNLHSATDVNTLTFGGDASTFAISGYDDQGGCTYGGFALSCTTDTGSGPWQDLVSDTTSWLATTSVSGSETTWMDPGYDDSSWQTPSVGGEPQYSSDIVGGGSETICVEGDFYFRREVTPAPTPLPTLSPIPTASPAPTIEGICKFEGVTTHEGHTVHCIAADGRLYDIWPVENGLSTCGANDANSCPDGTDIWVPRTHDHAKAVWDEFGGDNDYYYYSGSSDSYIGPVGVYRPADGGGCCEETWSQAMNSDAMASYSGVGWTSVAAVPEPWFIRSTSYSEPNGDYDAYCWLYIYHWQENQGWAFNDESCNACSTHYLCSTNEWATQPPTTSPVPTVTPVPTDAPCCPEEFNDCGTFCDYDGDCVGDNYCGDGSWDLCDNDYDDNCIICSFDKSWLLAHNCPPGYNDCGWGCDLDSDCSAYNEHTGADSEQYSGLAQVAYSCSDLPDNNYYYSGGYYYYGNDYYYYGNGECDDYYAWFWGMEIDNALEGHWSCWDSSNAILTYEACQEAAQLWADECGEGVPSVSYESWDGPQGCHVQNGPYGSWQFNSNFDGGGSGGHTPVCREDAWAGCPSGNWMPNDRNTNGQYIIGCEGGDALPTGSREYS